MFYKFFLGDMCLGPQCQNSCKYKYDKSSADIRIGDLWGDTYKDDQKGVSALVVFTEKGYDVVENLTNVTLIEHPLEIVAEGQMKTNARAIDTYPLVMYALRRGMPIDGVIFKLLDILQMVCTKLRLMIK